MTKDTDQKTGQEMEGKVCTKCSEWKSLGLFGNDKRVRDGKRSWCRDCGNLMKRENNKKDPSRKSAADRRYREKNKEKIAQRDAIYARENAETIKEKKRTRRLQSLDEERAKGRERRLKNPEGERERTSRWYKNHRQEALQYAAEWSENNREKRREISIRYNRKVRSTPKGRLSSNISRGVYRALKSGKQGKSTFSLMDYSLGELMAHLERQFLPGMTWENYGDWHVDHKVPLAAHNFETPKDLDFKRAWSLENLQPMWAKDNHSKGAKIIYGAFQPSLSLSVPENTVAGNDNQEEGQIPQRDEKK